MKNFAAFDESRREGVFFFDDRKASTYSIAEEILETVSQHGPPDHTNGTIENLDQWIGDG